MNQRAIFDTVKVKFRYFYRETYNQWIKIIKFHLVAKILIF